MSDQKNTPPYDVPPEDDFDQFEAPQDDSYNDDLSDEHWDDADTQDPVPPKKKKSGLFNIIIITVGVIVIAGVGYVQLTPKNAPRPAPVVDQTAEQHPQQEETQAVVPQQQMEEQVAIPVAAPSSADMGLPMPDSVENIENTVPLMPMPDEIAPAPSVSDAPVIPMRATPNESGDVATQPVADPVPVSPESVIPSDPVQASPLSPSSELAVTGVDQHQIDDVKKQMADLAARVEQASSSDVAKFSAQLEDISKRLSALEEAQKGQVLDSSGKETEVKVPSPALKGEEKDKESVISVPKTEPAAKTEKPSVPRYVLRAVGGNKAYISRPGSSTYQTITVGDQIDGYGRVQAIEQVGGRWVVRTSAGSIRQ